MPWLLATYTVLGALLAILFIKEYRGPWYVKLWGVVAMILIRPILAIILGIHSAFNKDAR
jgi:hypothetical protein